MKRWQFTPQRQFMGALVFSSLIGVAFFLYGAWRNSSLEYSYLCWNLALAWLPLIFAIYLVKVLRTKLWSSWEALAASILWLVFVPNSFYMISDFIHLQDAARINILYDAIMFTSFISTGVILGFTSLHLVHRELLQRFSTRMAASWIAFTLLVCSVAIYIGRDLRWNSWDILTNPGGLLFDVSDRLAHPAAYPQMLLTVVTFFVLLGTMYVVMGRVIAAIRQS